MVKKKSLKTKEVEKLLCIFCYKLVRNHDSNSSNENGEHDTIPTNSTVSVAKKMEICDKFFNQLHHPPLSVKKKKINQDPANASIVEEEEDEDDDKNKKGEDDNKASTENIAISWNHLKSGVCVDCFYAVDTYARLFGKVEKMQRRLRWQLDRLYKVMKCAGTIPTRVQDFQDNLKGDQDQDSVKDFRQKVFQTCRQRLKTLNINVDGLGWVKTKGQSEINLNTSVLNNSKRDLNSSPLVTPVATPVLATKSTSKKRKLSQGKQLERSPIKRAATQSDPSENEMTTIFKCSKCSYVFPSLQSLTNHAKAEHWTLKEEPGNHSDTDEEPVVMECTVEIKCGSKDEMRNLQKCIGKKSVSSPTSESSGTFSFSSADTEVRRNYPKLKKIYRKLQSHNPENDEEEEELKLAEKSSPQKKSSPVKKKKKGKIIKTKPKSSPSTDETDVICDKCGEIFTGTTLLQAEAQLFRHLSANELHNGEASWKYTCKICNKIFPKESTLTNHISKIHGNKKKEKTVQKKKFSCSHCQKKFGKKENLVRHFQNAHREKIQVLEVRRKKQMKVEKFEGGKVENESMMWEDCDDGVDPDLSVGDIGEHFEAVVVKHKSYECTKK